MSLQDLAGEEMIEIVDASPMLTLWRNDLPRAHKAHVLMMHIDWELSNIREWEAEHLPPQDYVLEVAEEPSELRGWRPDLTNEEKVEVLFDHIDDSLEKIEQFWRKTGRKYPKQ